MADKALNLYQRINAVLAEGKSLQKTGKMSGSGGSYNFHQTDELLSFLRPLLVEHGIHFSYSVVEHALENRTIEGRNGTRHERETVKKIACRLVNVDDPSEIVEGTEIGYGLDSQDKGPGKATSYAVKTWLLNVFMLRGQPDEESIETFDGWIGGEMLEEIQSLVLESGSDVAKILKLAKAESVEKILISKAGIIRDLLKKKIANMETAK